MTRDALMATYARPYARWLPSAYRLSHVPVVLGATLAVTFLLAVWELAGDGPPEGLVDVVIAAAIMVLLWTAWITLAGVRAIHHVTREWRPDRHELSRVRGQRPHAADVDPRVAHEEYAVAVGDDGRLETWMYTPLAALEDGNGLVLAGAPRYAARLVDRTPFDPRDAAHAAEQLAAAQAHAAAREAAAAERARAELAEAAEARELQAETRSTSAALRGLTGQSPE